MEDKDLLQSNGDDEVMVKQSDGTFKRVKLSALNTLSAVQKPVLSPVAPVLIPTAQPPAKIQPPPVKPIVKSASSTAPKVLSSASAISQVSTAPLESVSAPSLTLDFENQAEVLVERLAGNIASDLKPRVKMLLVSYMKGIRQEYAVRERLLQSVENGGLGWQTDRADLFLKQMKALSGQAYQESARTAIVPVKFSTSSRVNEAPRASVRVDAMNKKNEVTATEKAPEARHTESNLLPEIEPEMQVSKMSTAPPQKTQQEKPPIIKSVVSKSESLKQNQPPAPTKALPFIPPTSRTSDGIRASAPPVLKIIEEKGEKPRVVSHTDPLPPQKQQPHIAIPQIANGKADVKDIAYKPRLVGPLEEIRTLTLVDFRRLSRDPQVAVDKIHSKVELLGEESFEKKVKGVLAWRASEVNQLYNTLLNESLTNKKSIKEVLAARASRKEPTLTPEEFQAVMNLNRQLRF
ncbi:MAG: hypothetical protein HY981_03045 [Candidatus Magasanikbacteria bacterium]|nr:hypothetical protein [Candidatus Magasanikbacteria bacterium]